MLHSGFLRRVVATVGLGAAGLAPIVPLAAFAVFGTAVPSANVAQAAPFPGDIIPHIIPGIIDDGSGGIGIPNLPPILPPIIPPPGIIDDGTGGIGGILP
jgi:hypothetical protein